MMPDKPIASVTVPLRYAAYRTAAGVIGDPRHVEFTTAVRAMGWRGKGEPFDVLPLVVETPTDGVRLFELPERAIVEVPLAHPEHPWSPSWGCAGTPCRRSRTSAPGPCCHGGRD